MFTAVNQQSAATAVYEQVADQIVTGQLVPGQALPGERELAGQLGVSRAVVREALQRLAQSRLVEIRQGESTRILDFRASTDLALLPRLLVSVQGGINPQVLRSLLELRVAIGADASRLAARHRRPTDVAKIQRAQVALAEAEQLQQRQDRDLDFWSTVVEVSGNIAYQLAFNSMRATYAPIQDVIVEIVANEIADDATHARLVKAIERGSERSAESAARSLLTRSDDEWEKLISALETAEEES